MGVYLGRFDVFVPQHLLDVTDVCAAFEHVLGGFLVGLPLVDRSTERSPAKRMPYVAAVVGLFALIGLLTLMSFAGDAGDPELERMAGGTDRT